MNQNNLASQLTVSIIIPVHNGGEKFKRCLQSIAKASPNADQIIVVADGDTDGSRLVAENFGATVIPLPEAGGPAKARNIGAKAATGDILLFVDADVEIYRDTLEKVLGVFTDEPDLSALIGSYDDTPGAENFLSQYRNLFHHYTHQTSQQEASTFWGACGAIRRDIFWQVGGFDEKYRLPCIEDIELGYRLKKAGHRISLQKNILVKHLKEWRPISMLKADFFYRALPWTALILQNRQLNNDLNLQYSSRISVILVYTKISYLIVIPWVSKLSIVVLILTLTFLALNAPVYQFFQNKRGLIFALRTIPWHWLYYFYSGLAFAIGLVRHSVQVRFTYNQE